MVEIKMIHTSVHLSQLFYIPMKQVLSWSHFIHSRLHEDDGTWWRLSVVVPEENDSDWPHCGALISYFSKHGILSCGFTSSQSCGVTFRVLNTSSVVLCLLTFILQCRIPDYVFIPFMVLKKHVISRRSRSTTCKRRRKEKLPRVYILHMKHVVL